MKLDWKLLLEAATVFGGALASAYQWWNARFRSQLKGDFELLKTLEPLGQEKNNYRIVKAHIDSTIAKAYGGGDPEDVGRHRGKSRHLNKVDLAVSIIFLIGAIFWTWDIAAEGINWRRTLVAVAFAFCGIGAFSKLLHKRSVSKKVDAKHQGST